MRDVTGNVCDINGVILIGWPSVTLAVISALDNWFRSSQITGLLSIFVQQIQFYFLERIEQTVTHMSNVRLNLCIMKCCGYFGVVKN